MKQCRKCRNQNENWIPFCTNCGESLQSQSQGGATALEQLWTLVGANPAAPAPASLPTAGKVVEHGTGLRSNSAIGASDNGMLAADARITTQIAIDNGNTSAPIVSSSLEQGQPAGDCQAGGDHDCDLAGWCEKCGLRVVDQKRNHFEAVASMNFAGVSDRGNIKEINQDHCAVRIVDPFGSPVYIGVVCDGVSKSNSVADKAAEKACQSVIETIEAIVKSGKPLKPMIAIPAAIRIAHRVVVKFGKEAGCSATNGPETTIVLLVVYKGVAYIGWVGDSRAYWFTDCGCGLLTRDHNFVNDSVDSGSMSVDDAKADKRAKMITQALGSLDEDPEVSVQRFPLPADGRRVTIVLSSDGQYSIASEPDAMAVLVRRLPDSINALSICRALVEHAVTNPTPDGLPPGYDNTTTVCAVFN